MDCRGFGGFPGSALGPKRGLGQAVRRTLCEAPASSPRIDIVYPKKARRGLDNDSDTVYQLDMTNETLTLSFTQYRPKTTVAIRREGSAYIVCTYQAGRCIGRREVETHDDAWRTAKAIRAEVSA